MASLPKDILCLILAMIKDPPTFTAMARTCRMMWVEAQRIAVEVDYRQLLRQGFHEFRATRMWAGGPFHGPFEQKCSLRGHGTIMDAKIKGTYRWGRLYGRCTIRWADDTECAIQFNDEEVRGVCSLGEVHSPIVHSCYTCDSQYFYHPFAMHCYDCSKNRLPYEACTCQ